MAYIVGVNRLNQYCNVNKGIKAFESYVNKLKKEEFKDNLIRLEDYTGKINSLYTAWSECDPATKMPEKDYLNELLESTWTEKGWISRARKFYGEFHPPVVKKDTKIIPFIDAYQLQLSLKILRNDAKDIYKRKPIIYKSV